MTSDDPLFQPTLQATQAELPPKGKRPWRTSSLYGVGFFGGALAATMFALDIHRRLAEPDEGLRKRIALGGGLGTALHVAAAAVAALALDPGASDDKRLVRVGGRVLGLVIGWWCARSLGGAERRYLLRTGSGEEAFDRAFWPGLRAVLVWSIATALLVGGVVALRSLL